MNLISIRSGALALLLLCLPMAQAAVFYVNVNNASPTAPYSSWATAATNIQAAVDAASAGDTVLVSNGVYNIGGRATPDGTTNRVVVGKALALQSVNGSVATLIDGGNVMRCLYLTNGASLNGFTLTNGNAGNGAGTYCAGVTNVQVANCLFVNNTGSTGAGIYNGTLTNCTLNNNTCPITGGNGAGAAGSTLYNCALNNNVTGRPYPNTTGASWGAGANGCFLYNCTLSGNKCYGAGAHGAGANSSTLNNCVLTGGYADNTAGGTYNSIATNCVFYSNYGVTGGAISGGTYVNCLIWGNNAAGGGYGGVYWTTTLYNCTVTANGSGGALQATFFNSIVAGNSGGDATGCSFYYSCTPGTTGTGGITNAPVFVNAAGHDYHLAAGSPGIDGGTNFYVGVPGDLDGNLRIVNGRVDMGAYEYHSGAITVAIQANYTNVVVGYPVQFTGLYTGGSSNVWNFADGTLVTNQFMTAHTWTNTGDYVVSLTVYDIGYPSGVTGTFTVHVIAPPLVYVSQSSTTPVTPYASWATAATNIQDAVDICNPGYHVIVTNGNFQTGGRVTYGALTNRLVIDKPLLIQSVNGPQFTFISGNPAVGDSAVRCVYATNGVVLSGFTLTNGATRAAGDGYKEQSGAGFWCQTTNTIVTNCLVLGNVAQSTGGGAVGGSFYNSMLVSNNASGAGAGAYSNMLVNCLVSNNFIAVPYGSYSQPSGGGAYGCYLAGCIVASNIVDNGGWGNGSSGAGICNSRADNCTIYNNTANGSGAGAQASSLRNCTLTYNTCNSGYSGGGAGNNCSFTGCLILNNFAPLGGGTYESPCTNCVLMYNTSVYQGGGACSGPLVNCVLAFNTGSVGGGASADTYGTGAVLVNCTVYGNTATYSGGGIANSYAWNSIITGNFSPDANTNYSGLPANGINYSCTQPLPPDGTNNIISDPAFISAATGDFHLLPGSPCINAGTNGANVLASDLDGNPRITGGTIDLGPYEAVSATTYITQQPQNVVAYVGQAISFPVTVAGPLPRSYQWQFNGTNLIGATNATLTFASVQLTNAGVYNLVISNAGQTFSSSHVTLTVYYAQLAILTEPTNQWVVQGSNVTFTSTAYSPSALSYRWQFNGTNLTDGGRVAGSATPQLTISSSQLADAGAYQLVFSNQYQCVTSSTAVLTVLGKPIFTTQPTDVLTKMYGGTQTFATAVMGAPTLFYQWQHNGTNLVNNGLISGVNTTNLTLSAPVTTDSGAYTLVASNSFGLTVSTVANLTVLPIFQWGDWYGFPPQAATNVVAVACGGINNGDFNMVLRADGNIVTWGSSYQGLDMVPPDATNVVAIAAGDFFGMAIKRDGSVVAWGDNTSGAATVPPGATNVTAIAAGHNHALALRADGTVVGWGENTYGECIPPAGVSNIIAVAAGGNFSLALRQDGTVFGWGYNNYGQATVPTNATNIVAIAAGEEHSVALTQNGTVIGWGFNGYGYDVVPASATNMIAIAAANTYSLALRPDGSVLSWGYGDNGSANIPGFVTNVVAIAAKEYQDLLLIQDPTTQVPPAFWRQPNNVAIPTGSTAILSPVTTGSLPMNYQWYFNGALLSGQTNNWLALTAITIPQAGNYQVIATNLYGAATSAVAVVTEPPGVVTQPVNAVAFAGNTATFTGAASGAGTISYQWYANGLPLTDSAHITGSTTNSLTISNVQLADAIGYSLGFSNASGITFSALAALTVVSQPTNLTVLQSSNATLSVASAGTVALTYQWLDNSAPLANGGRLSGVTNAALLITGAFVSDSGPYQVVAALTNSPITVTSSVATLAVLAPATITGQPASQEAVIGGFTHFSAGVSGSALVYRWFKNGVPLADDGRIAGSASLGLSIAPVQAGDMGSYTLQVSNVLSAALSQPATFTPLTVAGPVTRFVNLNNPSPAVPYLDWSTAANNLQDAIDASVNGDSITVTDGVYQVSGRVVFGAMTNRVVVDKAVTIQSVNGPATTTIAGNRAPGNSAVRCVYLTNNAVLNGFTLTRGATRTTGDVAREQSGGGAWCLSTNTLLVNCVIISNTAMLYGGGEYFGTLSNCWLVANVASNTAIPTAYGGGAVGGVLFNCLLSNNIATLCGGGGVSNALYNCIVTGNTISNRFNTTTTGGGVYACRLMNCLVTNNFAIMGNGGGAGNSTLYNCLVLGNYAAVNGGGGEASTFVSCAVVANVCSNNGAGVDVSTLYNSLVAQNHALSSGTGAAAYISYLTSCTVVSNYTANPSGLGGMAWGGAANSIIYSNLGANYYVTVFTNCCVQVQAGIGGVPANSFTNDPLFVNFAAGDYHLQSNSPCINSGYNPLTTNALDLDGNPRIKGGTVDMGAYEYQTPASLMSYAWAQKYGFPTDGTGDSADADGDGMSNYAEWKSGTNPTNALSVLKITSLTNSVSGPTISWLGTTNVVYYVQRSTNLAMPFITIKTNITGLSGVMTNRDNTIIGTGPYFYRVGVQ